MISFSKTVIFSTLMLTLSACATFQSGESDKASFHDSAFNDMNRAPSSLTPPTLLSETSEGKSTLDPLYMRTQADYYFSLGETYSLAGDPKKAVESFKMTLIYDQNSPTVNMRLAAEYLKLGMVSESVAQGEEAVEKDPKNIEAHLLLGGLYSSLKFYPKAMVQYETVLKLNPKIQKRLYTLVQFIQNKSSTKKR